MEALPVEIADQILDLIFQASPQSFYGLRRVSKLWTDMVDRNISRLLKVWCKKCLDEIPENILDDFVRSRFSRSWQEYWSNELALPHIARDIYRSWNDLPNLDVHTEISFTQLFPQSSESGRKFITSAVNDKYFAICICPANEGERPLRIFSLHDLTNCIKDYPISDIDRMDFFTTDNQEFLIIQDRYDALLAEFLVNDDLIPANLPLDDDYSFTSRYRIIKNQCFYSNEFSEVSHYQFTPNGFKWNTNLPVPCPNRNGEIQLSNIQICNNNLFVSVPYCIRKKKQSYPSTAVYRYDIIQLPDEVHFSNRILYLKMISVEGLELNFGAGYIPRPSSICDMDPGKFSQWMLNFFELRFVRSFTIYPYHVLMISMDKMIVFRGNFRQLMDYVVKNADPGSKCVVIDVKSVVTCPIYRDDVHHLHIESKPRFLITSRSAIMMSTLLPQLIHLLLIAFLKHYIDNK